MMSEEPAIPKEPAITLSAIGSNIAQASQGSIAVVASGDVTISPNYLLPPPHPVDTATLEVAQWRIAVLPLDALPDIAPLPSGSHIPAAFSPNALFVGRSATLRDLAAMLKGNQQGAIGHVPVVTLTGIGGLGKTQLANEFMHRYGQYFIGGVFWLSFADASALSTEVVSCCTALGLELPLNLGKSPPIDQLAQWVRSAWQSPLPRLLVFDNCEEETLLREWCPSTGGCRVLVTSRRPQWAPELGVKPLKLSVFNRAESIDLLRKYRPDLTTTDLDPIANELGDLPLALHLAGSFLKTYRDTSLGRPAAYLAQLRQAVLQDPSLQGKGAAASPTHHEQSVELTFNLSYKRLDPTNPTDVQGLRLLERMTCFAPGVPLLRDVLLATLVQANDTPEEEVQIEDALRRLVNLGLLEELEDGAVHLHRLLQEFVQTRMQEGTSKSEPQTAVERVMLKVANYLFGEGYAMRDPLLQLHLRAVTDRAKEHRDEQAASLCEALAIYLRLLGAYEEALPYAECTLAIREQVLGDAHPKTALALNNLGLLYYYQGKYEQAEPLYQRALTIREQVLGDADPDTTESLNNLGMLYYVQGKYEQAESLLQRALTIWEQVLGAEHPGTAQSLNNLSSLYVTQGKYEQAESLLQRALTIWEQVLGGAHPKTALALNNLGMLYHKQGKYEQAEPLLQRALTIREQVLGDAHPEIAQILNNLGNVYYAQGKYEQAESLYQRALTIREQVLGDEHLDTALALNNLASVYYVQGKYEQAESLLQRALTIREQVLGDAHPEIAQILNNLGSLYHKQGKYEQAEPLLQRALTIREQVLGDEHLDTAESLNALGSLYVTQGKYEQAEPLLQRGLTIYEQVLGDEHPNLVVVLQNYATLLWKTKRKWKALKLYFRAGTIQGSHRAKNRRLISIAHDTSPANE